MIIALFDEYLCLRVYRRYIPALKNMPTRYIHEPWVAPESVQQSARCIIGRDYPLPMVDHSKASQVNIERIKQVYAQLAKYKPQGKSNLIITIDLVD